MLIYVAEENIGRLRKLLGELPTLRELNCFVSWPSKKPYFPPLRRPRNPQRKHIREPDSKPVPCLLGRVVLKRFQTSSIGPVVMSVAGSALLFGIGTQALP